MKEMLLIPVIKNTDNDLPKYQSEGAFAMDLRAAEDAEIYPGQTVIVKTNLSMAVPEGYALRVVPRSGLSSKGIIVSNSPGTIDEDYRGNVGVIMSNVNNPIFDMMLNGIILIHEMEFKHCSFKINKGDRIAQCYLDKKIPCKFIAVTYLPPTVRGEGGFGSTGK